MRRPGRLILALLKLHELLQYTHDQDVGRSVPSHMPRSHSELQLECNKKDRVNVHKIGVFSSASWRHWFAGVCGDMASLQLQLLQLIAGFDVVSVVFLVI
jgi:hypothetical protein